MKLHLNPVATVAAGLFLAAGIATGIAAGTGRFHPAPAAAPTAPNQVPAGLRGRDLPDGEMTFAATVSPSGPATVTAPDPSTSVEGKGTPPGTRTVPQNPVGPIVLPGQPRAPGAAPIALPPKGSDGSPPVNVAG